MRFTQECAPQQIAEPTGSVRSPRGVGGAESDASLRGARGEGNEERAAQLSSEEERGPEGGARRGEMAETELEFFMSPATILCSSLVLDAGGSSPRAPTAPARAHPTAH